MSIEGLRIIGESINDSVPSTNKLYKNNDIEGIKELARLQSDKGAAYIDVNVGSRSPGFMSDIVKEVQSVTSKPLAIDSPDFDTVKAGLEAYSIEKANGKIPILNSISPLRMEMFEFLKSYKFIPILMISEREINGESNPNHTVEETYDTAKFMYQRLNKYCDIVNDEIIFDVGIAPIASDTQGQTKRTIESIKKINSDQRFNGVHMSLGLSNFTVMLPPKCADGSPVKSSLESAFLTMTVNNGLDMVIGSVKRNYRILNEDHPAMKCLTDVLTLDGFDIIMRVQSFYA
ncbi:MAG TPA: dihydropteroate synthase [Victivallales bacterium]|nr:dihydropteroate synthase [Victivallales bacterium]